MDSLTLTTCGRIVHRFHLPSTKANGNCNTSFSPKPTFHCSSSKDQSPHLDNWDQMELKFGHLLGEDPKLTLAKIMGRKSNPDVSYLEIEKSFMKKKGETDDETVYFSEEQQALNLARPVRKKGAKPVVLEKTKKNKSNSSPSLGEKNNIPNVVLRKPSSAYQDDEVENEKSSSRLIIKPNLLLKMSKEGNKENFSDITLLKKPEPVMPSVDSDQGKLSSRSGAINDYDAPTKSSNDLSSEISEIEGEARIGLQPFEQSELGFTGQEAAITEPLYSNSVSSTSSYSVQTPLQGKPQRLDQSLGEISCPTRMNAVHESDNSDDIGNAEDEELISTAPLQEHENADWARAEELFKSGNREEVELISCSTRGFVASFGSLIGFLPYRNLGAKWKFLAFESWVRNKGLDPSMYKQNLGIVEGYELHKRTPVDENVKLAKPEAELSPNMKLQDLLEIYDQEKMKFLSSFVGLRIKVTVVLADRNSRRLMFSGRPREKEELVEKKRSLMAKLSVGDVVKGRVKKITYFGIFVEIEGVPALIHQSEVSWDATLDPFSFFKIGQIVEAKVHQLDFSQDRIALSLKEVMPDPLIEALESVIGDDNSFDSGVEGANEDIEWADVESLIKELQQIEGVQSVSKGRFLLSPGLAPTFQVYMGSMFENQYKLLARSGNKVQEIIVQASLDKEALKAAILACTNRVE